MERKRTISRRQKSAGILAVMLCIAVLFCSVDMPSTLAAQGGAVTSYKTGLTITYQVLSESSGDATGTVQLGNGTDTAFDTAQITDGAVIAIPRNAYIFDAWEKTRVYHVTRIGANAFSGVNSNIQEIRIEGAVEIDPHAFDGIDIASSGITFITNNLETKKALLKYRISDSALMPEGQVRYEGLKTKYVAFGDSISAGYALPGYDISNNDGDKFPTRPEAFPVLTEHEFRNNYGPAALQNMSVSGWTSQNLLDQLNFGDYNDVLSDATVVTVTIGSNDLLGPFIDIVKQAVKDSKIPGILEKDRLTIRDINNLIKEITALTKTLNASLDKNQNFLDACAKFRNETQPGILAKLHQLAPNAEIYWTTLYNPFVGQQIDLKYLFPNIFQSTDAEIIDLSGLGDQYIREMNKAFEQPDGYHKVDLYEAFNDTSTDLINVEVKKDGENGLVINFDPHPNEAGHAKIKELLMPVINGTYTPGEPLPDLSGEKELKSFTLAGYPAKSDAGTSMYSVSLPNYVGLQNLKAEFTLSDKSKLYKDGVEQATGITANNYTENTVFIVQAEDETAKTWTVNASLLPSTQKTVKGGVSEWGLLTPKDGPDGSKAYLLFRADRGGSSFLFDGLYITGSSSQLSENTTIQITALKDSKAAEAFRKAVSKGKVLTLLMDIRVAGVTPPFHPPLTLSIPVGKAYNDRKVRIFHYVNDKVEIKEAVVKDGKAEIQTESLSPFAVEVPDLKGTTPDTPVPDNTVESKLPKSVKTGDQSPMAVFIVLMVLAAAAVLAVVVKKRKK